jgi:hypothetical protein
MIEAKVVKVLSGYETNHPYRIIWRRVGDDRAFEYHVPFCERETAQKYIDSDSLIERCQDDTMHREMSMF